MWHMLEYNEMFAFNDSGCYFSDEIGDIELMEDWHWIYPFTKGTHVTWV